MAAAMGQDARQLVWQVLRGINHLRLQANLLAYVLAILHFQGLPVFFRHFSTPFNI